MPPPTQKCCPTAVFCDEQVDYMTTSVGCNINMLDQTKRTQNIQQLTTLLAMFHFKVNIKITHAEFAALP